LTEYALLLHFPFFSYHILSYVIYHQTQCHHHHQSVYSLRFFQKNTAQMKQRIFDETKATLNTLLLLFAVIY
jgi:hypothetical protein